MKKQSFVQNFGNASPEPSVAGTLSLIPGLGQFYNGERLKGWLFLEVGILNMALLGLLLCADSICTGLLNFGAAYHVHTNESLLRQLGAFKFGNPGANILLALCLSFVAYSVRDAYDSATNLRHREIYKSRFLDLSEAASGSYLAHVALLVSLMLLSAFLLIPPAPKTQVTEIEFVSQKPLNVSKPQVTNRVATKNAEAQGKHTPLKPVKTKAGETSSARQPVARTSEVPKPTPPTPQKTAPSPKPPTPTPTPQKTTPTESAPPARPMEPPRPVVRPVAQTSPAPQTPSPKPMTAQTAASAPFARPTNMPPAPVPFGATAKAVSPLPLLAFNGSGNPAPSVQPSKIEGRPNGAPRSWASGNNFAQGKSNQNVEAPAVDTASFKNIGGKGGEQSAQPALAPVGSSSRSTNGTSNGLSVPKPTSARSTPGGGREIAAVPHTSIKPVGDFNGGTPNSAAKGREGDVKQVSNEAEYAKFLEALQRRIRRAWYPTKQQRSNSTIVVFSVGTVGNLISAHVQRSSGDSSTDQAALAAVRNSAPFPHLPEYAPDSVDIQFTFDYNVFNGGRQF